MTKSWPRRAYALEPWRTWEPAASPLRPWRQHSGLLLVLQLLGQLLGLLLLLLLLGQIVQPRGVDDGPFAPPPGRGRQRLEGRRPRGLLGRCGLRRRRRPHHAGDAVVQPLLLVEHLRSNSSSKATSRHRSRHEDYWRLAATCRCGHT